MQLRRHAWRLLPFLVCIACYGAVASVQRGLQCPFAPDSLWYADVARFIASGQGLRCNITLASDLTRVPRPFYGWPPLYPAACAVPITLGLDPLVAARLVSLVAFLALPIPLLVLGKRLWGVAPAMVGTLLVPLWPTMFGLSGQALSEPLFLWLLAATLSVLVRDPYVCHRPVAAGLLLGAAGLTRLAGAVFLPALVLTLLSCRRRVREALYATGIFMASAGLWVARNSLATGAPSGFEEPAQALGLVPVVTACIQRVLWEMLSFGSVGLAAASGWKILLPVFAAAALACGCLRTPGSRILALWGLVYLVGISWLRTKGPFDSPSGGRTLAPSLMIFAFWIGGSLAAAAGSSSGLRRWAAAALLAGLALGVGYGRVRDVWASRSMPAPRCHLTECDSPGLRLLDRLATPSEAVLSNVAFKTALCQNRPSVQLPIRPYSALELSPAVLGALGRFHETRFVYLEEAVPRTTHGHDPLVLEALRGEQIPGLRVLWLGERSALYELVMASP